MGIPSEVIHRAVTQGGYITRDQLVAMGLSLRSVDRRVNAGELAVVVPGLYQLYRSEGHLDLMRGAILALPNSVVSHQSAAHLLVLPSLPRLVPTVTVPSYTTHLFPNVTVRRCDDLVPSHLTTVNRIPTTNVARTIFDLGGILSFNRFSAVAQAAVLQGRLSMRELEAVVAELGRRGKRGTRNAKDFLALRAEHLHRGSPLEARGRSVIADGGLPSPLSEFPIPWDERRRFDDAYPAARLAIEWDSRAWHAQLESMAADRGRDREAALHGWVVVRFTWRDVTRNPAVVVSTIASLLSERTQGR
jgi:hypothetical protein